MIQKLREKLSGVVALGLVVLIAIPLAFIGVESIFLNSSRVTTVAEVNGEEIDELELSREISTQQSQLMQIMGDNFDPAIFDSPALRSQALQSLIDRKVIYTEANSSAMGVSEAFIGEQLVNAPQFQIGGEFSDIAFRNYLGNMGFTVASFMETVAQDMVVNQFAQGIQATAFVTDTSLTTLLALTREVRSYEYLRLSVADQIASISVDEQEIADYYAANQSAYQLPERVAVSYLELDRTRLAEQVEVAESDVQARLSTLAASQAVERRVSHILIEADENSMATLGEIQQQLDAGVDFAELAQTYSADIGSASTGGDLGYTNGNTFPPAFEAALTELEVGQVSDPVETDAGIHLIQLTELNETEIDMAAEAERIREELLLARAEDEFQRLFDRMQELAFSTNNLEQLQEQLADQAGLDIQTSELFSRDSGTGIASNAQVRAIAFSDIVIEEQLNSEVISLGEGRAVVIHLQDRRPAQIQPLAEVRDQILATLQSQRAAELLASTASSLLEEARQGTSLEAIARREDLQWQVSLDRTRGNLDEVGRQVFALPLEGGLPRIEGFSLASGDYVIARVNAVESGRLSALSEAQQDSARLSLQQSLASLEWAAYATTLRNAADIDIRMELPEEGAL